jgi:uncharacterized RDD family membrane protein YckC
MTNHYDRIEQFIEKFSDCLVEGVIDVQSACAEMREHLHDADQAGELDEALSRLGSPGNAAAALLEERLPEEATFGDRLLAAAIDNLPLVIMALALLIQNILIRPESVSFTFPPLVYIQIGNACVAPIPVVIGECGFYNGGLLYALGLPLALAWSIVGLGLIEARNGITPGKRLLGLRVVSDQGLRIQYRLGIFRRLSFLAGPLAWVDWAPGLWGERQRVFDKLAGTRVVRAISTLPKR